MFPLAKIILKGALQRDECRGAHFKPAFAVPGLQATDEAGRRREAEEWCDRFAANTARWLKSTVARPDADGHPQISYEDVDTSLIPPRPRLYGLVGADLIEEVWRERQQASEARGGVTGAGSGRPLAATS
jgi:succinate dehydrogenase / fumarate reductase flavoprotein subunit